MRVSHTCYQCKQIFRTEEMLQYSTLSGKTKYWLCKKCYEEKIERERFQIKVCEIFGIKTPGPLIWTQRKRIKDTYGYTDDTIINCLEYIYRVKHLKILKESLGLVTPKMVASMKSWQAEQKAKAGSVAAAIANTELNEQLVTIRENVSTKREISLDEGLFDD